MNRRTFFKGLAAMVVVAILPKPKVKPELLRGDVWPFAPHTLEREIYMAANGDPHLMALLGFKPKVDLVEDFHTLKSLAGMH